MKEIKAYIRRAKAEEVAGALKEAGVPGFTVIEVKALGAACVPEDEKLSIDYGEQVSEITKIEVVCSDVDLDSIVDALKAAAFTGHCGDGMIYVTEVLSAIKIRNDENGEDALTSTRVEETDEQ